MNRFLTIVRQTLDRARRLPASASRRGRRPLLFGTLLLATSTASVVATANSAPVFTNLTLSKSTLNEGETVTLTGAFNDPDTGDSHTLLIYWNGDDSDVKQKVQLPVGQSTFQVSHAPGDSPTFPRLKVVIYDHQLRVGANDNTTGGLLSDTEFLPYTVNNVAPSIVPSSVTVKRQAKRQVVVEGDVLDPGTNDRVNVIATWSDPTSPEATTCSIGKDGRRFKCEHTYGASLPAGTYNIVLEVWDYDDGQSSYTTSVQLP